MNYGLLHKASGQLLRVCALPDGGLELRYGTDGVLWTHSELDVVQDVQQTGDENPGEGSLDFPLHFYTPDALLLVAVRVTTEFLDPATVPVRPTLAGRLADSTDPVDVYLLMVLQLPPTRSRDAAPSLTERAQIAVLSEISEIDESYNPEEPI